MSNFAIFLIGTVFVTLGLAFSAHKLGATPIWISIGSLIINSWLRNNDCSFENPD